LFQIILFHLIKNHNKKSKVLFAKIRRIYGVRYLIKDKIIDASS